MKHGIRPTAAERPTQRDGEELLRQAAGLLALTVTWIAVNLIGNYLNEYISARLQIRFQRHVLSVVMTRRYGEISHVHSGDILNYLDSDVNVVTDGLTSIVSNGLYMLPKLVGAAADLRTGRRVSASCEKAGAEGKAHRGCGDKAAEERLIAQGGCAASCGS